MPFCELDDILGQNSLHVEALAQSIVSPFEIVDCIWTFFRLQRDHRLGKLLFSPERD